MMDGAIDPLALAGYQFQLPTFEGPLDVLLRLIERDQLDIRDRTALGGFARGEAVAIPDAPPPRLAIHQPTLLARALRRRLTTALGPVQVVASARIVTLREMTQRLLTALNGGNGSFFAFRASCTSREEVLVAFLSTL